MSTNIDDEHLRCRSLNIDDFNQLKTTAINAFDNDLDYSDEHYITMLNSHDYFTLGLFNEFNVLRLRRERAEQSNKESYFFHVLNMV